MKKAKFIIALTTCALVAGSFATVANYSSVSAREASVTISFDACGVEADPEPIVLEDGKFVQNTQNFPWCTSGWFANDHFTNGKEFMGWSREKSDNNGVSSKIVNIYDDAARYDNETSSNVIMFTVDTTLYAVWEDAYSYTVTLHTPNVPSMDGKTINCGERINDKGQKLAGCSLKSWYDPETIGGYQLIAWFYDEACTKPLNVMNALPHDKSDFADQDYTGSYYVTNRDMDLYGKFIKITRYPSKSAGINYDIPEEDEKYISHSWHVFKDNQTTELLTEPIGVNKFYVDVKSGGYQDTFVEGTHDIKVKYINAYPNPYACATALMIGYQDGMKVTVGKAGQHFASIKVKQAFGYVNDYYTFDNVDAPYEFTLTGNHSYFDLCIVMDGDPSVYDDPTKVVGIPVSVKGSWYVPMEGQNEPEFKGEMDKSLDYVYCFKYTNPYINRAYAYVDVVPYQDIFLAKLYNEKTTIADEPKGYVDAGSYASDDYKLVLDVIPETDFEGKTFALDYNTELPEELKLDSEIEEKVSVVYKVKILKTSDNSEVPLDQFLNNYPYATVSLKLPDNIDITKVSKLLNANSKTDVEKVSYSSSYVKDGYLTVNLTKKAEFAVVTCNKVVSPLPPENPTQPTENAGKCGWHIPLIILCVLFVGVVLAWHLFLEKKFKDKFTWINLLTLIVPAAVAVFSIVFGLVGALAGCKVCLAFLIINVVLCGGYVGYVMYKNKTNKDDEDPKDSPKSEEQKAE